MKTSCLKSLETLKKSSVGVAGFTLVEMLVTIGVIGIIASIAVPALAGPAKRNVDDMKDRRNAQSVAHIYGAGQLAGLDFLVPNDLGATVDRVVAGGTSAEGIMAGSSYGVPGLTVAEKEGAMRYLELRGDLLLYDFGGR